MSKFARGCLIGAAIAITRWVLAILLACAAFASSPWICSPSGFGQKPVCIDRWTYEHRNVGR